MIIAALSVLLTVTVAGVLGTAYLASDRTRHDVTLSSVWDTEAAEILANQRDVTAEICHGIMSSCVEAFASEQMMAYKFNSESDAKFEYQPADAIVRGIFIVRWTTEVPLADLRTVEGLLEHAAKF